MKGLFAVLVLLVFGVVGLGFYQGWFRLSKGATDDKVNVTLTVDQDKIKDDTHKAERQVRDLGHGVKEKITPGTDKGRD
jgi:hypothetical protein